MKPNPFRKAGYIGAAITIVLWCSVRINGHPKPTSSDLPEFQNAHVETRSLQGPLRDEVRRWASASSQARWLGYAVPQIDREVCCSDHYGRCDTCDLEHHASGTTTTSHRESARTVHLEGSTAMAVMFRAENAKIMKIRVFSLECTADAGGFDVLWLDSVIPAESISFLESFVTADESSGEHGDSVGKGALTALALHNDPAADRTLDTFVASDRPEWLRREAAFWLGVARGASGLRELQKMAQTDPSSHVREQVSFALSVSDQLGALTEMIRMAHEDQSAQVRGQALFWLAQRAGKKAESTITGAIENDPDTEVKKKAVFALSQMPKDEGVPKLIQVAQTNKNPEVRKQAMFWLGQSNDPRALAFFEKILTP